LKKGKEKDSEKGRRRWVLFITIFAFFLSVFMSLFSDMLMKNSTILIAFIILIAIIVIGILFDMLGVAVTVADERPFNSMASSKIKGAKSSLMLIKNAGRVSNVFNDVVGDTCGIISGAGWMDTAVISVVLSGMVASATIGGKALGKEVAMAKSKEIVTFTGKIVSVFTEHK
jgi:hypothetical protein